MRIFLTLSLIFFSAVYSLGAGEIRLRAAVEKNKVAVGEPFIWQLQVDGTLAPQLPDPAVLQKMMPDFTVSFLGVQPQNSSFTSIINGRKTVSETRRAIVNYQLTANRAGTLRIPAVPVNAEGQKLVTEPLTVRAVTAEADPDFSLTAKLPRSFFYAGETLSLPVTLSFRENLSNLHFSGALEDIPGFRVTLPLTPTGDRSERPVALNGGQVVGRLDESGDAPRLTFTLRLRAEKPGVYTIPRIAAAARAPVDPFSVFDNFPFGGRRARAPQKRYFASCEPQEITVKELPADGRPADFSGLIGNYKIAATVEPAEAAAGDPLTLTVAVTGENAVDAVTLPDLNRVPEFAKNFRIPEEAADGRLNGNAKIFTQTLRAVDGNVKEVPPLTLSFFDPADGKYKSVKTKALPLTIRAARAVGTEALEGLGAAAPAKTLRDEQAGLAPNYADKKCLVPETPASRLFTPAQWGLLLGLPLLYLAACLWRGWRTRREDTADARRARGALKNLEKRLDALQRQDAGTADALGALREYCADRFGLSAASLTFADVEPRLGARVENDAREKLRAVFARAEAARYAAGAAGKLTPDTAREILDAARAVD